MAAPASKKLMPGEILFNEGDASRAMYFVQSGTIRLFKKKGESSIELALIHKGEVIGEMGVLDGGQRSASAEAIHETELMELTIAGLAEQMKALPPWLMILLKTIVNRLRSANNKIRQLESASTAYTYGKEGVSSVYQYLNIYDVMKLLTAALVVGARNGEPGAGGSFRCQLNRINRYANQIMGIPVTKIVEFFDIVEKVGLARLDRAKLDQIEVFLNDLDQIERLIAYINEENLKEASKKTEFSPKAVLIMGYIARHLDMFPPDKDGVSTVNLAKIINDEKAATGKEPFRLDDTFTEIVKGKLATDLAFRDNNTITTRVSPAIMIRTYRIQALLKAVEALNKRKSEQAQRPGTLR